MSTFFEMADQDWRVIVDDCDITEPTIAYPDQLGRGRMVGPLVKLYVGVTVTDEDGDEALELDGEELGRWTVGTWERSLGISTVNALPASSSDTPEKETVRRVMSSAWSAPSS